jgi:DNA ligase-1
MFTRKKEKMKFSVLSQYMERLEATTKRLEMFDILAELFAEAKAEEIDRIIRMCQGQLAPAFYGVELGISEKLLVRTLSDAADTPTKKVGELFRKSGDLGSVA